MNDSHFSISLEHSSIGPFATLLIVIVAVWLILFFATAGQNRKHSAETEVKICPGCSTPNPGHAGFCRNCGRKL